MATNLIGKAKLLCSAINQNFKSHVVISINEFFGGEGRQVRVYVVRDAYYNNGTYDDKELFKSAALVYVILYLRDLLYTLQGRDVPEDLDNEGWQKMKLKRMTADTLKYMKEKYVDLPNFSDTDETDI